MSMLNLFLLLMHRTAGGHQFGLRYAIELIPFVFARYITDPHEKNISIPESALMLAGLIFNMIGGILVHI